MWRKVKRVRLALLAIFVAVSVFSILRMTESENKRAQGNFLGSFAFPFGNSVSAPANDSVARAALGNGQDGGEEEQKEPGSDSETPLEQTGPEQSGFMGFPHQTLFNPQSESTFVVSFRFSFSTINTRRDRRIRLLSKYNSTGRPPFVGWVVAVRPLKTSSHPEVYWQNSSGSGGWYTFDKFDLKPGVNYDLTWVVKANQQMSLIVHEVTSGEGKSEEGSYAVGDGFLGGYTIQGLGLAAAETELSFPASVGEATVSRILLAQVQTLKLSRKSLTQFAKGGPDEIKKRLQTGELVLDYPPAQPVSVAVVK